MIIAPRTKATLDQWLYTGLAAIYRMESHPPRYGIVLGCALWGQKYIARFAQWCLPSLLEPVSALALRNSGSAIVIAAPEQDMPFLFPAMRQIELAGIDVRILLIPEHIMAEVAHGPNGQYWTTSIAQNLIVRFAARIGLGFHMLMPDHVYPVGYFARLDMLIPKFNAIVANTISANVETAANGLERYRVNGTLSIPAKALGSIGFKNLHQQMKPYIMGGPLYPDSHYMIWVGRGRLYIYSPHANIVWMSHALCMRAPVVTPATLDAVLPKLMPNGAYLPSMADELVLIELSDSDKATSPRVPFRNFLARCAMSINLNEDYLAWFAAPSFVPITNSRYDYRIPHDKIAARHAKITTEIRKAIRKLKRAAGRKETTFTLDAQKILKGKS